MDFMRAKKQIGRLFTPGESLSSRVVVSGVWVFLLRVISQVFQLARTVVLARLLAPDDFGLMGITMITMSVLDTFSQTGFQSALIQKKDDIEDYLDSAWTVLALRGIALYALLYLGAPLAAAFYETPAALPVIRVAGLVMVFNSLLSIRVVYFKKELEFRKNFIYLLAGTLVDMAVSIGAAFVLQSIWALVYGLLAGSIARLIVSYIIEPHRPRLSFDLGKVRELYSYGRWIFGASIFIFILTQGDDALLGKLLGVTALGFYQMAFRIGNMPATEITHVITQITFPAYAKLQDDPAALRAAYMRVLKLTALLSIPTAGGIFILSPEVTRVLLGEKWMPMVTAMQVLVVSGAVRSIGATMGPVFEAVGKPEIKTRLLFVQVLLMAAMIYPLTMRLGIAGTGLSVLIPMLIINTIFAVLILRIVDITPGRYFQAVGYPTLGTLAMMLLVYVLKTYLIPAENVFGLLVLSAVGAAFYFSVVFALDRFTDYRIGSVFQSIRASFLRAG